MLYTGKGDKGTTKLFDSKDRISKSALSVEALGTVDELNALLGVVKAQAKQAGLKEPVADIVGRIQQQLFIIQAELAGAPDKTVAEDQVKKLEKITDTIEKNLPPIKSFFVPGGTVLGAQFDLARTVARRAERRVVAATQAGEQTLSKTSLAYLNRLSSVLYALARLITHKSGIKEEVPKYK